MRPAAGLGYLLARTSDTLADTDSIASEIRMGCLEGFARALAGGDLPRWPVAVLNATSNLRERHLLEGSGDLLNQLRLLPAREAELVREVTSIIVSGQKLDLERFCGADATNPIALADDAALEDYTYRVAGCVGAFWTRLGFLTLGGRFSQTPEDTLIEWGISYGKGLQLVNILRDLPADLAHGRCYLPVVDVHDRDLLLDSHRRWLARACESVQSGFEYSETLVSRRLRAASMLPAMIAMKTLERMHSADWETLCARVKVPRREVYVLLLKALVGKGGQVPD